MREDPSALKTSSTMIKCRNEITHVFGRLLLQPSAGLLDKSLIMTTVCTIADDRYDAIFEIFL